MTMPPIPESRGHGRQVFLTRTRTIKHNLFVLCPNNSGSTFLSQAVGACRQTWTLPREGQHVLGFAGPSTLRTPWPLIWAGSGESLQHFTDPSAYDWARTKRAWYLQARADDDSATVFVTKAPPFLLLADQLRQSFEGARFLVMVRNPYAALEGILRRRRRSPLTDRRDLARVAALHLLRCLEKQRVNSEHHRDISVSFTYEEMCADPNAIRDRIIRLLPGLSDLDLQRRRRVKECYDEPLRNMNAEQIARLSSADLAAARAVFSQRPDMLRHFGYELL